MMNKLYTLLLILVLNTKFGICQNADKIDSISSTEINTQLLFEKWWERDKSKVDKKIADQYFEKDGKYKCEDPAMPLSMPVFGKWEWKDATSNVLEIHLSFFVWDQRIISVTDD